MFQRLLTLLFICLCAGPLFAQDLSNIQIHGFVTQGFLFSSNNNLYTMNTSDGSPRWTDAAVSLSDAITDNFHVGIQLHVYRFGELGGPNLQIDWATGDYHVNDHIKFVAGKVKNVYGLFTDSQDVDTVHLWAILPESIYPTDNKGFTLAHYGGDFYGTMSLGKHAGKLSYRGYAGYRVFDLNGGYAYVIAPSVGGNFTGGGGTVFGGDVRWQTPLRGFLVGASAMTANLTGTAPTGAFSIPFSTSPDFYAKFEKGKFMAATEFKVTAGQFRIHLNNVDPFPYPAPVIAFNSSSAYHDLSWYAMASYRLLPKLQVGSYYSSYTPPTNSTPATYSKDAVISGRYDFNSYFYAKVEGHFIHGTAQDYYAPQNPNGEKSRTALLAAKVGFSF